MPSHFCERAINDALSHGNAFLKFISPNDVGMTGSHQCGFYLPKLAWKLFSPHRPVKGENKDSFVDILWQNGSVTHSRVIWYGSKTRSEYRLTRFGKDFPYLTDDNVGDLLVITVINKSRFLGYVLFNEEDIEEIFSSLGVSPKGTWGIYSKEIQEPPIDEESCISSLFLDYARRLVNFPSTSEFSKHTWDTLHTCIRDFDKENQDDRLMRLIDEEYKCFKIAERLISGPDVQRLFKDIDDFLETAAKIMNRRKARAGRSFENHMQYILEDASIPHEMRPQRIDGYPDIVMPSQQKYFDSSWPDDKLIIVGLKTTCKDRWRQVLNEGKRIKTKHLITLQPGMSVNQLNEMKDSNVVLIAPKTLHKKYPKNSKMKIQSLESFLENTIKKIGKIDG